ncbi:unnamed protein product [Amoebophrya sp. A120]|nr:unnamed protein product [Amoebophrya sp. A120]|eukprot:GSA120T00003399001.1
MRNVNYASNALCFMKMPLQRGFIHTSFLECVSRRVHKADRIEFLATYVSIILLLTPTLSADRDCVVTKPNEQCSFNIFSVLRRHFYVLRSKRGLHDCIEEQLLIM